MGATAGLLIGLIAGGVGSVVANKNKKATSPPATPTLPTSASTNTGIDPSISAAAAAAKQKKAAASGVGRNDTILTGSRGLGDIQPSNTSVKTLLGY